MHATAYCKDLGHLLQGILIVLTDERGRVDTLRTDAAGIARTRSGEDTLELHTGTNYQIDVAWPGGGLRVKDRIVTDTLEESTTFVKEYFLTHCNDPTVDHRWRLPSIYFPANSAIPRNDSAWYQQEAEVNSVDGAVDHIKELMKENPTVVLRVVGYCDVREKDRARLALARANCVRDMLVAKGVPVERLKLGGRADDHRYSKTHIANMKDRHERGTALALDRKVGYLVVAYDYAP